MEEESRPLLSAKSDRTSKRRSLRTGTLALVLMLVGSYASVQTLSIESWEALALAEWTCSEVNPSDFTPKECAAADMQMCENWCLLEGSACEYLCEESCGRSEGAICIFESLSNLQETCASIANMTFAYSPINASEHAVASSERMLNCDHFAYCSYCAENDECSHLIQKPEIPYLAADSAADMFNRLPELCASL